MGRRSWIALVVTGAVLSAACSSAGDDAGPQPSDGVRVGAFDFAESQVVAELYAQALEDEGIPVVRLGAVGPREVVAPALEQDLIDAVPEYLGTALQYFGATTTSADTTASVQALAALVESRGLAVLDPAPAEDTNIVVVTVDRAETLGLERISDLTDHAAGFRFGGPVECPDRPLCLIGLRERYGLEFADFVPMRSLELTAAALQRGEIDVGWMFSTSAELNELEFRVLVDDRNLQPPENVVPMVRRSALDRWGPSVTAALDRVSSNLTTDGLRELNRQVGDGAPIEDVAAAWLAER